MGRLLSRAFWLRIPIAGLGGVPLNALFVAGAVILGFANPGVWLLAIGLEALYLSALVFNRRFQRAVSLEDVAVEHQTQEQTRQALLTRLSAPRKQRMMQMRRQLDRLIDMRKQNSTVSNDDDLMAGTGPDFGLARIDWAYLKLLVAQEHLEAHSSGPNASALQSQLDSLRRDLASKDLSAGLRESKQATLNIVEQRLENQTLRQQRLEEIESNLIRIDAQVELAIEDATIEGGNRAGLSRFELDLAFLDADSFGTSSEEILRVDNELGPVKSTN